MSRMIRKPARQAVSYEERLKEYFGFHLNGLRVTEDGGEIQIELVYCDFKHIDTVRRELAQMMPEVEFVKLRRDFTISACAYALSCMEQGDDRNIVQPEIYVKQANGSIVPTSLSEIARSALRQVELEDSDEIHYDDYERQMFSDEQLRSNASD